MAAETGNGGRSTLYLTVDVSAGVQKHLHHGLVPARAGVHEGGHSLWKEQAEQEPLSKLNLSERARTGLDARREAAHVALRTRFRADGSPPPPHKEYLMKKRRVF